MNTLIPRQDVTTTNGTTPEGGIYITVKLNGALALIYDVNGDAQANPFQSGVDGSFSYYVFTPATYIEEYRFNLSDSPRTIEAVNLDVSSDAYAAVVAAAAAEAESAAQDAVATQQAIAAMLADSGVDITGLTLPAASRAILSALDHTLGIPAYLTELGREGTFTFSGSDLSTEVANDGMQGVYIAPAFDTSGNSGAWVRRHNGVISPKMFGAVGNGVTDDRAAVQAAADFLFQVSQRNTVLDLRDGPWAISDTVYFSYNYDPKEATPQILTGRFRVLPVASQPGGVAMTYPIVIVGYRQRWVGTLVVDGFDDAGAIPAYANRRFKNGVLLSSAQGTVFDAMRVDGAKRDAVRFDSGTSHFRTGTPYEVNLGGSSNIGVRVPWIFARGCGSCQLSSAIYGYSIAFSANTQSGSANSPGQRSALTMASTAEFEVGDMVASRLEIGPSVYTTIASDNTAGTFAWAAGDPTSAGLQVGDFVIPSGTGFNGESYEIISFSGTSNRTIKVYPKPPTTAAQALTSFNTRLEGHQVRSIDSGTQLSVFPWVPSRLASGTLYSLHGWAANITGSDTANISLGFVGAIQSGGTLWAGGLYGPVVETFLAEDTNIAIAQGLNSDAAARGLSIRGGHAETTLYDYVRIALSLDDFSADISASSSFSPAKFKILEPRTAGNTPQTAGIYGLGNVTIRIGGMVIHDGRLAPEEGLSYADYPAELTNDERSRQRTIVDNNATIKVNYDEDIGRLAGGYQWAELFVIGPTGAAPSGTIALQLSDELAQRGWSFAGTVSYSSLTKPLKVRLTYYNTGKKILVTQYVAA